MTCDFECTWNTHEYVVEFPLNQPLCSAYALLISLLLVWKSLMKLSKEWHYFQILAKTTIILDHDL